MPRLVAWLVACLVGSCLLAGPALADKRAALVIGNSAYKNVPKLANPANDAASVAALFRDAQFEVVEARQDLGNIEMRRLLRDFSDKTRDADIAVVFYAGHGIEVDGVNYLVPVDSVLERDSDAYDEAISLDRVLQAIEPAKRLRLVILDACRDNPFARTMKRTVASRSLGRGLAGVEPGKPNTLIAFAAKGGSTADDGNSEHSPFTVALLKHLTTPGLDLRKAFGLVRDDVMKATGNRQEPFVYGSLGGTDVSLVPAPTQAAQPQANPQAEVRRDYELALQLGTRTAWESFLRQYPAGFYADLAKGQLAKIAAEEARNAAAEKAKAAEDEKARLVTEKASAAAQAKAAADAKAAEDARIAAEKAKQQEATRAAAAEQARAAAERAAADKAAKEQAEADAKAIREKAQAEAKAIRDKAEADARAAEQARKAAEQEAERLRVAAVEQAKSAQSTDPTAAPAAGGADKPAQLAALPPPGAAPVASPQDIARALQTELRRVGCFTGTIDGEWKAASQRSLDQFNKFAGMKLDVKLASLDAIDAVKAKVGRVCPLFCQHGFRADGDACVKITCKSGYQIGDDNTCEKIETKRPQEKSTVAAKPAGGAEKPTQATSGCANVPSGSYLAEQMGCNGKPSAATAARPAEGTGSPAARRSATASSNGQQIVCNGAEPCRPLRKGCRIERNAAAANTVAREVCD